VKIEAVVPHFMSQALTPVDAPVDQRPAPGVLRPALAVADREHVDMAVEREVAARLPGRERRDDVRHRLLWRDHAILDAAPVQQIADMRRRGARVAGGLGLGQRMNRRRKSISRSRSLSTRCNSSALRLSICQSSPGIASAAI
jgi:hypothetical protein